MVESPSAVPSCDSKRKLIFCPPLSSQCRTVVQRHARRSPASVHCAVRRERCQPASRSPRHGRDGLRSAIRYAEPPGVAGRPRRVSFTRARAVLAPGDRWSAEREQVAAIDAEYGIRCNEPRVGNDWQGDRGCPKPLETNCRDAVQCLRSSDPCFRDRVQRVAHTSLRVARGISGDACIRATRASVSHCTGCRTSPVSARCACGSPAASTPGAGRNGVPPCSNPKRRRPAVSCRHGMCPCPPSNSRHFRERSECPVRN